MLELPPPGTMSRSAAEAEVDGHIRWACHHAEVKRLKVRRALRAVVDHPRFLFSVLGGLKFDHGFDELSGKRNLVSWLSQPVLADLLDQFTGRGNHAEA